MLFETDRLVIRRLLPDDAAAMLAIYGDKQTVRYVGDSEPLTLESCLYWVEVTDRNFERRGYGMVAFVDRQTDEIIGCGGIVHPDQQEEPEVKYAFRRDQWGKGYATEAVVGLVRFGRENWGIGRIVSTVYPENLPSQQVLAKAGFSHLRDEVNDDATITQVWENLG